MTISKKRISDAEIDFISLVDRAANKKSFLIAKAQDGKASFSTYGKIVKVKTDSENHFVTGIVYEPMAVDTQGDYMTAEEIQKAAHWYARNGTGVDIQHDEKKLELIAFILLMIPGTPKDVLTYMVSLTDIKPARFYFIATFARVPSVVSSTLMGATLSRGKPVMTIIIFLITAAIGVTGIFFNNYITSKKNSAKSEKE